MSSPFFLLPFFVRNKLRNSNNKNTLANLGKVYAERTINDVKGKDPMEKSYEPTVPLKFDDHAGLSRVLSLCNDVTGQEP